MSLKASLQNFKYQQASSLPTEVLEVLSRNTSLLQDQKMAQKARQAGEPFPHFELADSDAHIYSLESFLSKGPLIVSFYRGGWCPYCVLELKALREIIERLPELNATLVAISPETTENVANTKNHNELNFVVLSDHDNQLARACGLVFKLPEDLLAQYRNFGIHIDSHNGNDKFEIPIPATYIIDSRQVIQYAFIEEDYTSRAEPEAILEILNSMGR